MQHDQLNHLALQNICLGSILSFVGLSEALIVGETDPLVNNGSLFKLDKVICETKTSRSAINRCLLN